MRGKKLKLYTHMFYDIKLELQNLFFFNHVAYMYLLLLQDL